MWVATRGKEADYKHQDVLPPDLVLLQEGPEERSNALAPAGAAQRLGYRVRFDRDVWVLVRNTLQSRPVHFIILPGGRACFVEVQGAVVGSVYVTHHFDRDPFLREVLEFVESLRQPWLLAGDFNLQVPENWLCEVLCVEGNHWFAPNGATSSRWDGNRLIDYCVSSVPGISCEFSAVIIRPCCCLSPGVGLRGFGCTSLLGVLDCMQPSDPGAVHAWKALGASSWTEHGLTLDTAKPECDAASMGNLLPQQAVDSLWSSCRCVSKGFCLELGLSLFSMVSPLEGPLGRLALRGFSAG